MVRAGELTRAHTRTRVQETHSPEKVDAETDIIPPQVRVRIMQQVGGTRLFVVACVPLALTLPRVQLGFRRVVVDFFQPPLAEGKEAFKGLWLGVYQPDLRTAAIEADLVRAFVDEYWLDCCGPEFANDAVYREMALQFAPHRTSFPVVDFTTSSP
jgi:hypothetical protein